MRWQPDGLVCAECGFDWEMARQNAVELVARAPDAAVAAIRGKKALMGGTGARGSAWVYVWHLVDVLRMGPDRLPTLTHDAGGAITCGDETPLAEPRRYQLLSPAVGLIV